MAKGRPKGLVRHQRCLWKFRRSDWQNSASERVTAVFGGFEGKGKWIRHANARPPSAFLCDWSALSRASAVPQAAKELLLLSW